MTLRGSGELALLAQEAPAGVGALAGCGGLDGGADVLMLVEDAHAGLAQGADGWAMALAIAERAQASFVFVPTRGRIVSRGESEITLVLPADRAAVGLAALDLAVVLTLEMRTAHGEASFRRAIQARSHFVSIARSNSLDQLTLGVARRATELDIPVHFLAPRGNIIQLGQGHLGRLMRETVLEPQSGHATSLARDKWTTLARLRAFGLPALPSGLAMSADNAVALRARSAARWS